MEKKAILLTIILISVFNFCYPQNANQPALDTLSTIKHRHFSKLDIRRDPSRTRHIVYFVSRYDKKKKENYTEGNIFIVFSKEIESKKNTGNDFFAIQPKEVVEAVFSINPIKNSKNYEITTQGDIVKEWKNFAYIKYTHYLKLFVDDIEYKSAVDSAKLYFGHNVISNKKLLEGIRVIGRALEIDMPRVNLNTKKRAAKYLSRIINIAAGDSKKKYLLKLLNGDVVKRYLYYDYVGPVNHKWKPDGMGNANNFYFGNKFQGRFTWVNGKQTGKGVKYTWSPIIYTPRLAKEYKDYFHDPIKMFITQGNFDNLQPDGFAEMLTPNKTVYRGIWKKGKAEGTFLITTKDGKNQKIKMTDSEPANGARIYLSNSSYVIFDNETNNWEGIGKWVTKDFVYNGHLKELVPDGNGTFMFNNGDRMIGKSLNGILEGNGTYNFSNGDKIIGKFVHGGLEGNGTYNFSNGDKIIGKFVHGGLDGKGTYNFSNGDKITGTFVHGVFEGNGTYKFSNGNICNCIYSNGNIIKQECYNPDGTRIGQQKETSIYDYFSQLSIPQINILNIKANINGDIKNPGKIIENTLRTSGRGLSDGKRTIDKGLTDIKRAFDKGATKAKWETDKGLTELAKNTPREAYKGLNDVGEFFDKTICNFGKAFGKLVTGDDSVHCEVDTSIGVDQDGNISTDKENSKEYKEYYNSRYNEVKKFDNSFTSYYYNYIHHTRKEIKNLESNSTLNQINKELLLTNLNNTAIYFTKFYFKLSQHARDNYYKGKYLSLSYNNLIFSRELTDYLTSHKKSHISSKLLNSIITHNNYNFLIKATEEYYRQNVKRSPSAVVFHNTNKSYNLNSSNTSGVFLVARSLRIGKSKFDINISTHTYILIIKNGKQTTYGGTNDNGKLVVLKNQDSFINPATNKNYSNVEILKLKPKGKMTEDLLIQKAKLEGERAITKYSGKIKYGLLDDNNVTKGNCHSISKEIINSINPKLLKQVKKIDFKGYDSDFTD